VNGKGGKAITKNQSIIQWNARQKDQDCLVRHKNIAKKGQLDVRSAVEHLSAVHLLTKDHALKEMVELLLEQCRLCFAYKGVHSACWCNSSILFFLFITFY